MAANCSKLVMLPPSGTCLLQLLNCSLALRLQDTEGFLHP